MLFHPGLRLRAVLLTMAIASLGSREFDPSTAVPADPPAAQPRQWDIFGPANYWECILKHMPGTQNEIAAYQVARRCYEEFPDQRALAAKEKAGGLFSVPRAADCFMSKGKSTASHTASRLIFAACRQVYWE